MKMPKVFPGGLAATSTSYTPGALVTLVLFRNNMLVFLHPGLRAAGHCLAPELV
jgi:hypothetical protein